MDQKEVRWFRRTGELPHDAVLGAWRPRDSAEVVHPNHVDTLPDGTQVVPVRIYGSSPENNGTSNNGESGKQTLDGIPAAGVIFQGPLVNRLFSDSNGLGPKTDAVEQQTTEAPRPWSSHKNKRPKARGGRSGTGRYSGRLI